MGKMNIILYASIATAAAVTFESVCKQSRVMPTHKFIIYNLQLPFRTARPGNWKRDLLSV